MIDKSPHIPGNATEEAPKSLTSMKTFVSPGILLFLDQLIVAAGGWLFWIMIPRLTSTAEIGQATAVYSLVLLVSTITQLGLEYPLLKKSKSQGSKTLGSVLIIEMMITVAAIIPTFLIFQSAYELDYSFVWFAIGILVFSSLSFVSRFALLGIADAKNVLLFDLVGTVVKFVVGIGLVSNGSGAIGILFAFLLQSMVVAVGTLLAARHMFRRLIGYFEAFKENMKDGLVNSPSKLSNMLVVSLSVVLLAAYGLGSEEVGIFYIAVMVSIVVGSFASSLAYMSIPASSALRTDLSSGSLRMGLGFTAPIIAALIVAPGPILSIIGDEYSAADEVLVILAAGIIPSVILSNAISKFNNLNKPVTLLAIGTLRIVSFLIAFYLLVPQYGILGASYAILISFSASAALSLFWSERILLRYLGITILSVGSGVFVGKLAQSTISLNPLLAVIIAVVTAFVIVFHLRCISVKEVSNVIRMLRR